MIENSENPKILLIEDIKIAQRLAIIVLSELHCNIDVVNTGSEGLQLANQKYYDLIFLDLGLLDMDGITFSEVLRNSASINNLTPIVALTAHSDAEIKNNCLKAGINECIAKPLSLEVASTILNKFIFK